MPPPPTHDQLQEGWTSVPRSVFRRVLMLLSWQEVRFARMVCTAWRKAHGTAVAGLTPTRLQVSSCHSSHSPSLNALLLLIAPLHSRDASAFAKDTPCGWSQRPPDAPLSSHVLTFSPLPSPILSLPSIPSGILLSTVAM